jgi:acyl dehydratase
MSVKVTNRIPGFDKKFRDASRYAVDAAAALYEGNVKRRMMRGYYTSGAFRSTAQIVQHVQREKPVYRDGGWETVVGIPSGIRVRVDRLGKKRSLDVAGIALAWELGHQNLFTRKFERVEIFKPVLLESAQQIVQTYARILKRYLDRGAA